MNRLMKKIFITAVLLAAAVFGLTAYTKKQAPKRPNVIVIYTDDQGYADLNIYGSKDLQTPNMDALARSGVRFMNFYAAAPICSPSRASLLTGRYPQRAGLPVMASSKRGWRFKHAWFAIYHGRVV